jgi:N-acetyl-gamma-glutamyl-phosphate reductase
MIEAHERDDGPVFELYALGLEHKHIPETQLYSGLTRRPIFVPSVESRTMRGRSFRA